MSPCMPSQARATLGALPDGRFLTSAQRQKPTLVRHSHWLDRMSASEYVPGVAERHPWAPSGPNLCSNFRCLAQAGVRRVGV
jgi:hypothetical protein